GALVCSPGWARTSDPSINSRMLCQLSYGGKSQSPADVVTSLANSPAAEQSDPGCFRSQPCGYPHQPATGCRTVRTNRVDTRVRPAGPRSTRSDPHNVSAP